MSVPILTTTAEIEILAADLGAQSAIAVDLEADSMHCYQEKVCLLQFSTPEKTWLVDPLVGADLAVLKPLFADPAIRKIFHAADYDIRCLHRDFGIEIRGLFDTMICSQFLGEEKIGLADLLGKYFGVELDKKYQRADWAVRPLSEGMIRYAAEDTRHLHRLCALLEERIAEKGRIDWVSEEFAILEGARFQEQAGPRFLRTKGAAALDGRQLALLEELLVWRDREAQRRDSPPFKVLGNKSLLEMARIQPRTLQGLLGIEGISPRIIERYGRALLEAVEAGLALPDKELPSFPRSERRVRDPEAEKRLSKLKDWRTRKAAELGMDSGIVVNNSVLEEVARRLPRALCDLDDIAGMKRWQRNVLGEDMLRVLQAVR